MNYIKAKYIRLGETRGRAYTFKTEDTVATGDLLVAEDGKHLFAVEDTVDMDWVNAYGDDKIAVVKKVEVDADAKTESV